MAKDGWLRLKYVTAPVILALIFTYVSIDGIFYTNAQFDRSSLRTQAEVAATIINGDVNRGLLALRGFETLWLMSDLEPTEQQFQNIAKQVLPALPGLVSVKWLDAAGTVRSVYPPESLTVEPRQPAFEKARFYGVATVSEPIILPQGWPGIVIFVPVIKNGIFLGTAAGVIKLNGLFESAAAAVNQRKYTAAVEVDGRLLTLDGRKMYAADDPEAPSIPPSANALTLAIPAGDQLWNLVVFQRNSVMNRETLPFTLLGVFFVLSLYVFLLAIYRQFVVTEKALALLVFGGEFRRYRLDDAGAD